MSEIQRPSTLFCETPLAVHVADRALHQIGAIVAAFELGNLCLGQAIAQIEERVAAIGQLTPQSPTGQALALADTRLTCAVLETLQTRAAPNSYSNSNSKESAITEIETRIRNTKSSLNSNTNSYSKEQTACQNPQGDSNSSSISDFDSLRSGSLS
jgi:hypothetical protein